MNILGDDPKTRFENQKNIEVMKLCNDKQKYRPLSDATPEELREALLFSARFCPKKVILLLIR